MATELKRRFARGVHDCCTVAADHYLRLTGIDPMEGIRGEYLTAREAIRYTRKHGGAEQLIDSLIGSLWPKGGGEICLLADDGDLPCVGVSSGPFWRVLGVDSEMLLRKDFVVPIQTWGP